MANARNQLEMSIWTTSATGAQIVQQHDVGTLPLIDH
jgi:hypothetical protein